MRRAYRHDEFRPADDDAVHSDRHEARDARDLHLGPRRFRGQGLVLARSHGTPPCRFGALMADPPRCIAGAPVTAVTLLEWGATSVDVDLTWETLGPMPDEVAAGLGVGRQRHLGHIPWLDYEGPDPDAQG